MIVHLAHALMPPSSWLHWSARFAFGDDLAQPRPARWRRGPFRVLAAWMNAVVFALYLAGGIDAVEQLHSGVSGS